MADFEIIERLSDLEALARDLRKEKVIGVDTEADSFYHYFDKTCLVQIGTRRQTYLVDPLALGGPAELAPLGALFEDDSVRKVFHAAEYDLYVLKRDCGFRFANLFDTMVSAQLLGYPSIGLAALIEHHFDVSLPKDEQRSDWSRRPLSDEQQTYAAADVQFLIRLCEKLERELRKKRRLSWAEAEFEALVRREWPAREFDSLGYLRIKGARKLDPRALSVLRELYLARDARAREVDRPPFKVLGNRTLLELAEIRPRTQAELARIKGVTDLIVRRMGRDIMAAIKRGRSRDHGPIPKLDGTGRRRVDRRAERLMTTLKRWRQARAHELGMDPGVLCPNAALEAIALRPPRTESDWEALPEVKSWFATAFGDEVVTALAEARPVDEANPTAEAASAGGEEGAESRPSRRRGRRGGRRGR